MTAAKLETTNKYCLLLNSVQGYAWSTHQAQVSRKKYLKVDTAVIREHYFCVGDKYVWQNRNKYLCWLQAHLSRDKYDWLSSLGVYYDDGAWQPLSCWTIPLGGKTHNEEENVKKQGKENYGVWLRENDLNTL